LRSFSKSSGLKAVFTKPIPCVWERERERERSNYVRQV